MKKRIGRLISVWLIIALGVVGPLQPAAASYASEVLNDFDYSLSTSPYIQFGNTSPAAITMADAHNLIFTVEGTTLQDVILGDTNNRIQDFIESFAVQLTNTDTNQVEAITVGKGNLISNAEQDILEIVVEVGANTLDDNMVYRLDFLTPTVRTLIGEISANIHQDTTDPTTNVHFTIEDSGANILFENGASYYRGSDITATPSIKEFNATNNMYAGDTGMKFEFGDISSYGGIQTFEVRFEGTQALTTSPGAISAYIGDTETPVTGMYSELYSAPYVYSISVDNGSESFDTQSKVGFELDTQSMAAFNTLIQTYLVNQPSNGNIYILGYNSAGDVVGYNLITAVVEDTSNTPDMFFTGVTPDFSGFYETVPGPSLSYVNTGVTASKLYLNGQTTYPTDTATNTLDFFLHMNQDNAADPDDFIQSELAFESHLSDSLSLGTTYDPSQPYTQIPVNIFEKNAITLSHNNGTVNTTEIFNWMPTVDILQNKMQDAHLKTEYVTENSDITVDMSQYTGRLQNLTLSLKRLDTITQVALYEAVSNDVYTDSFNSVRSTITFSPMTTQPTESVGFDGLTDAISLGATLIYDNADLGLTSSVDQIITGTIQYDEGPINPYFNRFNGIEGGLYTFIIDFGDQVNITDLQTNLNKYLSLENESSDLTGVSISSVEGYLESNEMHNSGDPYWRMKLAISGELPAGTELVFEGAVDVDGTGKMELDHDSATNELIVIGESAGQGTLGVHLVDGNGVDHYKEVSYSIGGTNTAADYDFPLNTETFISPQELLDGTVTGTALDNAEFFLGLSDFNGNPLVETRFVNLQMDVNIQSALIDETGAQIANGEVRMILVDDIPDPALDETIDWADVRHLQTNDTGILSGSLPAGEYLIFEISEKDEDGIREERRVSVKLNIPVSAQGYTDDIVLPAFNVTGNVLRSGTSLYEEDLIFIESSYLSTLQAARAADDWSKMETLKMFYLKEVTTKPDGLFGFYLDEGNYTLIGKFEGDVMIDASSVNGDASNLPYEFTVGTTGATITDIEFPPPTITGVILDSSGAPLEDVFVEIESETGYVFEALTGTGGVFNMVVNEPDTYKLILVNSHWESEGPGLLYIDDTGFDIVTITQAQIDAVNAGTASPVDMGNVQLPQKNFTIQFTAGGQAVGGKEHSNIQLIQEVANEEDEDFYIPSRTGYFDLYIPNGNYTIDEFNYGDKWVQPDPALAFTLPSTDTTYNIELGDFYNARIRLLDESQEPMAGFNIDVNNEYNNMYQNAITGTDGYAYFNFEVPTDGSSANVKVISYSNDESWHDLYDSGYILEVNNTHSATNKAELTIQVQSPNFYGSVYRETMAGTGATSGGYDPNSLLMNGHLDIRKEADQPGQADQWYSTHVNSNGEFTFTLNESGNYIIESAGSNMSTTEDSWFEIKKTIYVDSNLKVIDSATGLEMAMPVEIGPQADNFFGKLYRSGTTPYLSTVPTEEYHVSMVVREKDIDDILYQYEPWKYEYRINVQQDGSFSALLNAGKDYEVYAVETSRGWFEFSAPLDITLSTSTESVIRPPVPNFNGRIAAFDGTSIENIRYGRVELEKSDGTWIGTEIDDTGQFGMALKAGDIYKIREYWYETEMDSTSNPDEPYQHTRVQLDRKMTVGTNSDNLILSPNFKLDLGVSSDLIATDQAGGNHYNANIQPVLDASDFDLTSEYENYQQNPWEYNIWVSGQYNQSTGSIEFYTYLEDGQYKLLDVNGYNMNINIGEDFLLNGVDSEGVTYETNPSRYTLDYSYQTNVTGTIAVGGQPVVHAWVNFMRTDVDFNDHTMMKWYGAQTDENGEFALSLPADDESGPAGDDESTAEYKLEGYNTEGYWNGVQWVPGKWTPVNYKFQINADEALTDTNGTLLDSITIAPNLTGEVYKIFKAGDSPSDFIGATTPAIGDYVQAKEAWMTLWPYDSSDPEYEIPYDDWDQSTWTQTDPETGQFNLMLDPGEYIVTDASMNNYWFNPEIVFTIDANRNLVDGADDAVENGVLIVKPEQPNFSGTMYTDSTKSQYVKWGWMSLKPADASEHDWENARWFGADELGRFEYKLDDGSWVIREIGSPNSWERVNIPILVENGTVTSTMEGIVTADEISIYPPDANLKGVVKNKSGDQIQTQAWLTIKPAEASEYDWNKAYWVEYELQEDNTYLFEETVEPGEYKIVEVGSYDFYYKTDVRFTIDSSGALQSDALENGLLVVQPPQPNLTGTVYGDLDNDGADDDAVGYGWLGVARYENGVQVQMDGSEIASSEYKDEWNNMYWQYTRWTETNENGKYEMNLDSGNYMIIGVGGQGVWYQPRLEFEIEDDEVTVLDIQEPGPNVTITVTGVPAEMQSAQYAWMDVYRTVGNMRIFEPVEYVGASNGNLIFEGNLPNATYTLGYLGTELGGLELEDTFTVEGETSYTTSLGEEVGKVIVNGQVLNNGTAISQKAWIKMTGTVDGATVTKKTQSDSQGRFKFKVPENTTWTITEISLNEGYLFVPSSAGFTFTSGTSATPSADWDIDIGSLLD